MKDLLIIGAGGFGREVCDLANYCFGNNQEFRIKGFLSDNHTDIEHLGYPPIIDTIDDYQICENDIFTHAIGNVYDRKKCITKVLSKGGFFINLIHPSVVMSPTAKIGTGVIIKAFCVLASNVVVGNYTFLQSSVILGHDVEISAYCQINSFSFIAGNAKVDDLATLNAGSKIIQNTRIGKGATIGIGSIIINDVPDGTKMFGNPARIIDET